MPGDPDYEEDLLEQDEEDLPNAEGNQTGATVADATTEAEETAT